MKEIHFSVDDILGAFQWLEENKEKNPGVFDSPVFRVLRGIHEKYGLKVSCFCFYENEKGSLADISDQWKEEFRANSHWMTFGFHAWNRESVYTEMSVAEFDTEFQAVNLQLQRIVGEGITDTLRLHFFSGNRDIVHYLSRQGVHCLLTADDTRVSLGMTDEEHRQLFRQGKLQAEGLELIYLQTNIRLEKMESEDKIAECIQNAKTNTLVVFTHEIYLTDENIMKNLPMVLERASCVK